MQKARQITTFWNCFSLTLCIFVNLIRCEVLRHTEKTKTHFFGDILPERVPCSDAGYSIDRRALSLAPAPVDVCTGVFFQEKCVYKEFPPSLRHEEPRWKKTFQNL